MIFLLCLITLLAPCFATFAEMPLLPLENNERLVVNNRILVKVHGKTISVVDVMKKMDVFLSHNYPQHASSTVTRYQFFASSWKDTLQQMINNELMMADAEQVELKVSDGDVRESLQERFGPNVMASLDKLGITYDEAWQIVYSDLVVQRMNWFRVHSKAMQSVNPQDIKAAYKDYLAQHPPEEKWLYQVLSIRAETPHAGGEIAKKAFQLLHEQNVAFSNLGSHLQEDATASNLTVSLSPDYEATERQLSQAHKEVILKLSPGSYSEPIAQVSKADGSTATRIFYLKSHTKLEPPAFEKMADKLYDELMDKAVARENALYMAKLRERFGHDIKAQVDLIPSDFQPFALK